MAQHAVTGDRATVVDGETSTASDGPTEASTILSPTTAVFQQPLQRGVVIRGNHESWRHMLELFRRGGLGGVRRGGVRGVRRGGLRGIRRGGRDVRGGRDDIL